MSAPPLMAVCPGCKKSLRIPEKYVGKVVKCKHCGTPVKAAIPTQPEPLPLPDDEAPATPGKPRRPRYAVKKWAPWGLLLLFLVSMAGLFGYFKDDLIAALGTAPADAAQSRQASLPTNSGPAPSAPRLIDALKSVPTRPTEATRPTASRPRVEPRPIRNAGKIPWPYPARALLIGIKNYVYLNPLNPGYPPDRGTGDDPLGLQALQRVLTEDLSLRRDQVLQLSDVADVNPTPPLKETILATLTDFCRGHRPEDRLIILFAGHAALVQDLPFLVPIEGQLDKPDSLLPLEAFFAPIAQSSAQQKLVIFDVAQLDPEQGAFRTSPGPLPPPLAQAMQKPPAGVQVWLSCSAAQHSYQFFSSGFRGSTFLHFLARVGRLTDPVNWKRIENDPQLKAGELPLLVLAPHVNREVTQFVKQRWHVEQVPLLVGVSPKLAPPQTDAPPPNPVRLVKGPTSQPLAEASFLQAVLRELDLSNDPQRRLDLASLPPLAAKAHANYAPDYPTNWKTLVELKERVGKQPLRVACVEVVQGLQKKELQFRMRFRHNPNETAFKKMLEDNQHLPATAEWELTELLAKLQEALEKHRDAEPSPRWRAHADLLHARLLARIIQVREYNFVLGNKLRKDSPVLQDKVNNNGWVVIPQERLQQKETRDLDQERKKLLDRIMAEHPGTLWEVLAQRERLTWNGLTIQEAKVE
jgi:hypothetical protein